MGGCCLDHGCGPRGLALTRFERTLRPRAGSPSFDTRVRARAQTPIQGRLLPPPLTRRWRRGAHGLSDGDMYLLAPYPHTDPLMPVLISTASARAIASCHSTRSLSRTFFCFTKHHWNCASGERGECSSHPISAPPASAAPSKHPREQLLSHGRMYDNIVSTSSYTLSLPRTRTWPSPHH